jgi:hypothetical protein
MSLAPTGMKAAQVTFNPEDQTADHIHEVVKYLLGKAGCLACGQVAILNIEFRGDPDRELAKAGVISVSELGFSR